MGSLESVLHNMEPESSMINSNAANSDNIISLLHNPIGISYLANNIPSSSIIWSGGYPASNAISGSCNILIIALVDSAHGMSSPKLSCNCATLPVLLDPNWLPSWLLVGWERRHLCRCCRQPVQQLQRRLMLVPLSTFSTQGLSFITPLTLVYFLGIGVVIFPHVVRFGTVLVRVLHVSTLSGIMDSWCVRWS